MNQNEQVQHLRSRVGQLTDRVQNLENNLKDTQEKVQHDVKRLADLLIELQQVTTKQLVPPVR